MGADLGGEQSEVILCEYCSGLIDPKSKLTFTYVSGWEKPRPKGGLNALTMMVRHDRFAHAQCVRRQMQKVSPQQPSLF